MTQPLSADGCAVLLDADQTIAGAAYARLAAIVDRLLAGPFDRAAYRDMQVYLDTWACPAAEVFDRIAARDDDALAGRAAQIEAAALLAHDHGQAT
jgi:hypothetical protein